MLETGRARTFNQRSGSDVEQAVASCPVSCMHPVSFRELKEYETARDEGDGRTDHRHLGKGHIPLYVAGIDSDMNRRSSWYHTLKHRCLGTYIVCFPGASLHCVFARCICACSKAGFIVG